MSGTIQLPCVRQTSPLTLVPHRRHRPREHGCLAETCASEGADDTTHGEPRPDTKAACARVARTRDPLTTAEALAHALTDPLVAAERGTFDGLARDLHAAFAVVSPVAGDRFAARLAICVGALGAAEIEWTPPTLPPHGPDALLASAGNPVAAPRDNHNGRVNSPPADVPPVAITGSRGAQEETRMRTITPHGPSRRATGEAPARPNWRRQLAAVAAELAADEAIREKTRRPIRAGTVAAPSPAMAAAPGPEPDLDAIRARRAQIIDADHERRAAAEAALAERDTLRDRIATLRGEQVTLRRERDQIAEDQATAFTAEAREGLAALATELARLDGQHGDTLARVEAELAALDQRPEVTALLEWRGRQGGARIRTEGAVGWHRRRPEAAAATAPAIAAGQLGKVRDQRQSAAHASHHDPAYPVLQDTVEQRTGDVKRRPLLDAVERARQLLRAGDAENAIAVLSGVDVRGVGREVERQLVGVLFAAAETAARAQGMDDFRYLRLDRGVRVLLACEAATAYGVDGAAPTPVYRVVAATGGADERFQTGQPVATRLAERAQPRRSRS